MFSVSGEVPSNDAFPAPLGLSVRQRPDSSNWGLFIECDDPNVLQTLKFVKVFGALWGLSETG